MCIGVHMNESLLAPIPTHRDPDDCAVTLLHPAPVAAARGRIAESPAAERVAALFALLGDPTRARLLTALTAGELCVCDLAAATGINRTTVSHQLRVLREGRLVRRRRAGKVVYYALADDHVVALLAMGAAHAAEEAIGEDDAAVPATMGAKALVGRAGVEKGASLRRRA